jgi:hypothetical protein
MMADEIVIPLKYLSMVVSVHAYEDEQARQIVVDELKLRIASMGAKFHNIEWHFHMGENLYQCFVTYYEVPNGN